MVFVPFISAADLSNLPEEELTALKARLETELTHANQRVDDIQDALTKVTEELSNR